MRAIAPVRGDACSRGARGPQLPAAAPLRRLWFVRIPKPPEVGAIKALEQELETYRAQYKLLTESFNVKKVRWGAARRARVYSGSTTVRARMGGAPAAAQCLPGLQGRRTQAQADRGGAVRLLSASLRSCSVGRQAISALRAPAGLQVERDAARQNTRAARDAFKACLEAYEAKRAIVQPMRDAAASTSEEAKKLRGQFRCAAGRGGAAHAACGRSMCRPAAHCNWQQGSGLP